MGGDREVKVKTVWWERQGYHSLTGPNKKHEFTHPPRKENNTKSASRTSWGRARAKLGPGEVEGLLSLGVGNASANLMTWSLGDRFRLGMIDTFQKIEEQRNRVPSFHLQEGKKKELKVGQSN